MATRSWSGLTQQTSTTLPNSGITGTLAIANGGTGQTTATNGNQRFGGGADKQPSASLRRYKLHTVSSCSGYRRYRNSACCQRRHWGYFGGGNHALVGNLLFPVGSIYTNATNATNPGTLLGFGTWTAFGAGRVMVGFDAGNALFDTAEETGGSADATLPTHTHTATTTSTDSGHNSYLSRPWAASGAQSSQWPSLLFWEST
jgi:hypothetical protein